MHSDSFSKIHLNKFFADVHYSTFGLFLLLFQDRILQSLNKLSCRLYHYSNCSVDSWHN
nr:MAG TPA: hypothetical protein [Caudoviricetes sp.]